MPFGFTLRRDSLVQRLTRDEHLVERGRHPVEGANLNACPAPASMRRTRTCRAFPHCALGAGDRWNGNPCSHSCAAAPRPLDRDSPALTFEQHFGEFVHGKSNGSAPPCTGRPTGRLDATLSVVPEGRSAKTVLPPKLSVNAPPPQTGHACQGHCRHVQACQVAILFGSKRSVSRFTTS